jgi:hypothetical protein
MLVVEPCSLGVKIEDVPPYDLFVTADGVPGSGKRVWKKFPYFPSWEAQVEYMVFDDMISEEVFERYLTDAGQFIGVGSFRPANRGWFGRFEVKTVEWSSQTIKKAA